MVPAIYSHSIASFQRDRSGEVLGQIAVLCKTWSVLLCVLEQPEYA
jgi:hypothetical protein